MQTEPVRKLRPTYIVIRLEEEESFFFVLLLRLDEIVVRVRGEVGALHINGLKIK